MTKLSDKRKFYIDGEWTEPSRPYDRAVAAAKAAFPAWSRTSPAERLAYVEKILEIYNRRADEIAAAMTSEMGAPKDMSLAYQTEAGTSHIENFIAAFKTFKFLRPLGDHAPTTMVAWEPLGVVGLIIPWNWPMNQLTLKVIPALLAGNTSVLKPSEIAPLSSLLFAEIVHEAGVPKGVFNLVNGDGAGVGTQLSKHPDVDMISFTGSTRAGIAITKAAADTLKKVTLELGGKGANLIFADAYPKAVEWGVWRCFINSGQSCSAPTRMLVERSVYDQAVGTAARMARQTAVGPADQPGDHLGPVVSKPQWDKVQDLIQQGIREGARLVAGGPGLPEGVNRGYYVRPTVFADVDNAMTIARQEIFGPVLSIIPFDSEEEAVEIANDTIYGLTNFVQTQDGARRNRIARRLRAGMVEMNAEPRGAGSAFGGIKASGRAREGGVMGLEEFMDSKHISAWDLGN
jgi:aldehyde dehydrogenase (NAD+)